MKYHKGERPAIGDCRDHARESGTDLFSNFNVRSGRKRQIKGTTLGYA
jgi:hypothetical protein